MQLPLNPPVPPQLAKAAKELPAGEEWVYEPKWDGFRALIFVDGEEVYIQSRNGRPLRRYFPELTFPDGRYVLDGEIVVFSEDGRQDFDTLGQRLHPAESRVRMLARKTPAQFIAFDLLALNGASLLSEPQIRRHELLAEWLGRNQQMTSAGSIELTPTTDSPIDAQKWLQTGEGVVAKLKAAPYRPGERTGMLKIKRIRTIDAVVHGYRPGKEAATVGSLLLALYDDQGALHGVGHCSGLSRSEKRKLIGKLKPFETGNRGGGEPSRWQSARDLEWIELRPELVVEVSFDHVSNNRIRHGTTLVRWRDDKPASECLMEQLKN